MGFACPVQGLDDRAINGLVSQGKGRRAGGANWWRLQNLTLSSGLPMWCGRFLRTPIVACASQRIHPPWLTSVSPVQVDAPQRRSIINACSTGWPNRSPIGGCWPWCDGC
jgi:hypothetical protein